MGQSCVCVFKYLLMKDYTFLVAIFFPISMLWLLCSKIPSKDIKYRQKPDDCQIYHLSYIKSNTQHITWIIIKLSAPEKSQKAHSVPQAVYKELTICLYVCGCVVLWLLFKVSLSLIKSNDHWPNAETVRTTSELRHWDTRISEITQSRSPAMLA